uniref:Isoleucine--tRNA ligase n=1 Tax=Lygus hesperus TaxID=30085 RepID=A0A0A9XVR0_LYGHE
MGAEDVMYLEGMDQHRGWFQSSSILSFCMQHRLPFKYLVSHGFVLDELGNKMSKSLGNVVSVQHLLRRALDDVPETKSWSQVLYNTFAGKITLDVLRMWVASADYTHDITISVPALQEAQDTVYRWRSMLRFILGCIHNDEIVDRV